MQETLLPGQSLNASQTLLSNNAALKTDAKLIRDIYLPVEMTRNRG